jgi:hypothetical protein
MRAEASFHAVLLLPGLLVGCGGDDTPSKYHDATVMETSMEAASDASVDRGKVLLVHASPNFPAVRWCFAAGLKADGSDAVPLAATPLPDTGQGFPQLAPGAGFVLPDIGDLSGVVVPYAIDANKIKTTIRPTTCAAVLPQLVLGGDYQRLGPIPAGTFAPGKTVLAALTGCLPTAFDPGANVVRCGGDFNPLAGNLSLRTFDVDRTGSMGKIGAQLAHLSAPLSGSTSNAGLDVGFRNAPDAGTIFYVQVASSVKYGHLEPPSAAQVQLPSPSQSAVSVGIPDLDGGFSVFTFPLSDVAAWSGSTADQWFASGASYTFVLSGQPDAGDGGELHVIALPSDPTVPKYP